MIDIYLDANQLLLILRRLVWSH